ncbi:MAG: hypothetical protein Q7U31_10280, partial [Anaerolineaceae bacterium]|nr:hypothetical protein [Anaerolineaceae bacterium]
HNAGLALVVLLPVVGMSLIPLNKKRQRHMIAIAISMMLMSLVGCFGLAFYGSVDADIKITKFEYAGGSGPANWTFGSSVNGNPIWVFKEGTANYTVDFFIEVSVDAVEGNTTTNTEECSGTVTYAVTGGIYEDMTVIIPSDDEE